MPDNNPRALTEHLFPNLHNEIDLGHDLLRFKTIYMLTGKTTRAPVAGEDLANKTYVDSLVGGPIVEEVDGAPSITGVSTLRFDQADGFVVTNPGANIARVDLAQSIAASASPTFVALSLTAATNQIVLDSDAAVNTGTITMAALSAARIWTFPDVTGTLISTGNLSSITATGTIASGVWNGTAIADAYIATALTAKTYSSASQAAFTLNPYGAGAGNTGEIRFLELAANGTSYVGFKASDALAGTVLWTLPIADGTASQALTTNASAILAWTSVGLLASANTWAATNNFKQAYSPTYAIGSASLSGLTPDMANGNVQTVTVTASGTPVTPSNAVSGMTFIWVITQDGTGSRVITWPTNFHFAGGIEPTLSTAAGSIDVYSGVFTGTNWLGALTKDHKA